MVLIHADMDQVGQVESEGDRETLTEHRRDQVKLRETEGDQETPIDTDRDY